MIDEELYQKAADELNSDRRRPHIWARACALADDDHDEARYLYTNLRVEELLAEAERGGGAGGETAAEDEDVELALEPVEFGSLPEVGDGRVESIPAGGGGDATPFPDAPEGDDAARPESVRGRLTLDLEHDATLDLDPDDVQRLNEAERGAVSAIDGRDVPDGSARYGGAAADGAGEPGPGPIDVAPPTDAARDEGDAGGELGTDEPFAGGDASTRDDGSAAEPPASADAAAVDDDANAAFRSTRDDGDGDASERTPVETSSPPPLDDPTVGERFFDEAFADDLTGEIAAADALDEVPGDTSFDDWSPDDGVVETVGADGDAPDDVGIDDTIALDPPPRPSPGAELDPLDDLDRLDEVFRAERRQLASPPMPPSAADDDALTRELRRQAEELPGADSSSVIAHEPLDTLPTRRVGQAPDDAPAVAAALAATAAGTGVVRRGDARTADEADAERADAGGVGDVDDADAPHATADDGPFAVTDEPFEITDERGGDTEYAVFVDDGGRRAQAVRQGNCWGALLATLPWLLYRRLFGTAIVYALFALTVLAGLLMTGLAWQEAGAAATLATKGATIGFALLAVFGLLVLPFRKGNHWREDKLERRGFELVAYVRTRERDRAIALAREAGRRQA